MSPEGVEGNVFSQAIARRLVPSSQAGKSLPESTTYDGGGAHAAPASPAAGHDDEGTTSFQPQATWSAHLISHSGRPSNGSDAHSGGPHSV